MIIRPTPSTMPPMNELPSNPEAASGHGDDVVILAVVTADTLVVCSDVAFVSAADDDDDVSGAGDDSVDSCECVLWLDVVCEPLSAAVDCTVHTHTHTAFLNSMNWCTNVALSLFTVA